MVVMDGDLLDIVCPRPASSSSACGDAVASPSACCEGQAAIPPALPPAQKVSAADPLLQRPKVSDELARRSQNLNLRIEILKRARLAKALKRLERRAVPEVEDSFRCAQAWDSTQLHFGDLAARSAMEREVKHKLQFSMHGALKLAYTDAMDKKLCSTKNMCTCGPLSQAASPRSRTRS